MKKILLCCALLSFLFHSTSAFGKKKNETQGDPAIADWSGYQPLDPFPIVLSVQKVDANGKAVLDANGKLIFDQKYIDDAWTTKILHEAADETIRTSIRDISGNSSANYTAIVKGEYKGQRFELTMDVTKTATESVSFGYRVDANGDYWLFPMYDVNGNRITQDQNGNALTFVSLPVYIGIGARLTASYTSNSGAISTNFAVLGVQGEAKQITGNIVIQTLGMSDETIPFSTPLEINASTIQNELVALGALKTKLHDKDVTKRPRVVGFYNSIGGGKKFVMAFITYLQSLKPTVTMPSQ